MKVLLDQGTPAPLRTVLAEHHVETAFERGWLTLTNGALLAAAEAPGFEVFITTDQNLRYQQNLLNRRLAIIVILTANWPRIKPHAQIVADALESVTEGAFLELMIPFR